jgi:hypothetical protein
MSYNQSGKFMLELDNYEFAILISALSQEISRAKDLIKTFEPYVEWSHSPHKHLKGCEELMRKFEILRIEEVDNEVNKDG